MATKIRRPIVSPVQRLTQQEIIDIGPTPPAWCRDRVYLTSTPYPTVVEESLDVSMSIIGARSITRPMDELDVSGSIESGLLRTILRTYTDGIPEELDVSASIESGVLHVIFREYLDADPEELDVSVTIVSGILKLGIISYIDGVPEELDVTASIESGTLLTP